MSDNNQLDFIVFNVGGKEDIKPSDTLTLPEGIGQNSFVLLNQAAPVWRFIKAFQQVEKAGAGIIATNDIHLKAAVIVASKIEGWEVDDVVEFDLNNKTFKKRINTGKDNDNNAL